MKNFFKAVSIFVLALGLAQSARADDQALEDQAILDQAKRDCYIGAAVGATAAGVLAYRYNKNAFFHEPMTAKDIALFTTLTTIGSCPSGALVGAVVHGNNAVDAKELEDTSAGE